MKKFVLSFLSLALIGMSAFAQAPKTFSAYPIVDSLRWRSDAEAFRFLTELSGYETLWVDGQCLAVQYRFLGFTSNFSVKSRAGIYEVSLPGRGWIARFTAIGVFFPVDERKNLIGSDAKPGEAWIHYRDPATDSEAYLMQFCFDKLER